MKLHINSKLIPGSNSIFIEGDKNGILFLHGIASTPQEFKQLIQSFEPKGYSLTAPLMKGHGTHPDDLKKTTWQDWFLNIKTELFDLRKKCERIVIVGQSSGASLALHLAAHYQVEALILFAPGISLKKKGNFSLKISNTRKLNRQPLIKDKNLVNDFVGYDKIPGKAMNQLLKLFKHLKDDLADIHSPILLFHAFEDDFFDYLGAQYIYNNISSKSKQFLTLNNSNHILSMDSENETILKETRRFINKIFNEAASRQGA